jgi:flagellin-like protein
MNKGLSPIISTLVLIVIIFTAAVIIYIAVSGFIQPQITPKISIIGKSLASEEARKGIITLTIVNTGNVPLKLKYLRVLNPGISGTVCYYSVKNVVNSGPSDSGFTYLILGEPLISPFQSLDIVIALRPASGNPNNFVDKNVVIDVIAFTPQNTEVAQIASFKYQLI